MADQVTISQQEVDAIMQDVNGPVGDLMRELADQIATVARATAPVLNPKNAWSLKSTAYMTEDGGFKYPGYTKANITTTVGQAKLHNNYVFGGANAPGNPGIFLEKPAEQMHDVHPFLTTGLWSVHVG